MNHTNRALNRILTLVIGLVFFAAGAATITALVWPAAATIWTDTLGAGRDGLVSFADASRIGDGPASWVAIGAIAVAAVLIALLIWAIARLIRGRGRTVLRIPADDTGLGRIVVREAFASDAVTTALDNRPDVLSARVTADVFGDDPVLRISITPRQTASPRELVDEVSILTANLHALIGQTTRTYVSLHSGIRAKLAADSRHLT
ncbi:hypothetical protein LQ938_01685 [Microbacterium sp. cx-55]|uniref:hypothetical protein n=1 Tax=Microbacterium sp. cx-55 TaxID=2875948 RepID=UPI001CBBD2A4|nr:hypothetical protein [Microbacterium sp. cx-55]MBZ4487516.1 hypothetical protein [Microbacterium sp. cx-55]UGB35536.1 hypothetical protein LQ938_01685 [Microbacterium sp. cx-55]